MDIEKKLEDYRTKKRREEKIRMMKDKFKSFFKRKVKPENIDESEVMLPNEEFDKPDIEVINSDKIDQTEISKSKIISYVTLFFLWLLTYVYFIKMEFGAVFLIISGLFFIYFNTRTGPRDPNEISAYSVFNKNCESIDGTLNAEQFEREIRFGAQSVH